MVSPCSAQVLDEIVVTAQKREENLQDVGIAVTAFSGNQLKELGMADIDDLDTHTPGLIVTAFGGVPAITVITVRGVSQNDFTDHNEGPNAVYLDGAYTSFLGGIGMQMFDVERVEVLRGPQGTLFGRNATGGVVQLLSNKPTDKFEGFGDLTFASYDQIKFQGAISGPLHEKLLGRLSVATDKHDGYFENRVGPDFNERDSVSLRGQLHFLPSDDIDLLVNLRGTKDDKARVDAGHVIRAAVDPSQDGLTIAAEDSGPTFALHDATCQSVGFPAAIPGQTNCNGFTEPDDGKLRGAFDTDTSFERESYGTTGTLNWRLDNDYLITSITDYQYMDKSFVGESDNSPIKNDVFFQGGKIYQASQELRLSGQSEQLDWTLGFYFLHIDGEYNTGFDTLGAPLGLYVENDYSVKTESLAGFFQVEYDITPQWSAIGGIRWTEDDSEVKFRGSCIDEFGLCALFSIPGQVQHDGISTSQDSGDYSYKLALNWRPQDDLLLYAGISRGNKAGGFNASALPSMPPSQFSYDPEVLTSFEGGFKWSLLDSKLRFNGTAFHYDYEDYQAFNLTGVTLAIFNADADVNGAEFEIIAQPAEGLELLLGLSLLDATVKDITLFSGRVVDQDMPQSPDVTLNGILRKEWGLFGGTVVAQGDFVYVDERTSNTINHPVLDLDSYVIGNARVSYRTADDRWEAAFFVKNIADAEYEVVGFERAFLNATAKFTMGLPRWFGGTISYRWN